MNVEVFVLTDLYFDVVSGYDFPTFLLSVEILFFGAKSLRFLSLFIASDVDDQSLINRSIHKVKQITLFISVAFGSQCIENGFGLRNIDCLTTAHSKCLSMCRRCFPRR